MCVVCECVWLKFHTQIKCSFPFASMRAPEPDPPLVMAARSGDIKRLTRLLGSNKGLRADPNQANAVGRTALLVACKADAANIVGLLLNGGASAVKADNDKNTPLVTASHNGNVAIVSALLRAGAPVGQRSGKHGCTALFAACQLGNAELVKMLIREKAVVDQSATGGDTPLQVASELGHADVVAILIGAGATCDLADEDGVTPLFLACQEGHHGIASFLLAASARADQANDAGATPMLIACQQGRKACVQLLSSYCASREWRDVLLTGGEERQIVTAEDMAEREGHHALTTFLRASRHWTTPLHHVTQIDPERCRRLLRLDGSDLHAAAEDGAPTPLSLARAANHAMSRDATMPATEAGSTDGAADTSAVALVLQAARPWSPTTHALHPAAARAWAVEMLLMGHRLSRLERFSPVAGGLFDVWMAGVMPLLISRDSKLPHRDMMEREVELT